MQNKILSDLQNLLNHTDVLKYTVNSYNIYQRLTIRHVGFHREVKALLHDLDEPCSDEEVVALMKTVDHDKNGNLSPILFSHKHTFSYA